MCPRFVAVWVGVSALLTSSTSLGDEPRVRNILLIVSDDLKASVLGCYGDETCQTPNIDRLATKSMVFDRAYCQGTTCRPSRESFMFGRYRDRQNENLGALLIRHDRYSARVGKIYHMRVPGDIIDGTDGIDYESTWIDRFNSPGREAHTPGDYACLNLNVFSKDLENRQSTAMPHRMFVSVAYEGDGTDQPDAKSASKAIELLQANRDRPFFLAVGLVRPHYPMVAPQQYFDRYPWQDMTMPPQVDGDLDDIPVAGWGKTLTSRNSIGEYPDNQKRMWAAYYAAVSFMDQQVGRIVDELEELGLRDSTAVVFISDHGYHLGEHGFWQKANLHEEVIRVPMMISVPGGRRGRSSSIVELVDLYPTLCQLVGLAAPEAAQGMSLVPVLADPSVAVKQHALSFARAGTSLRSDDWHYMKYRDGSAELYNMNDDIQEFTNLADDPAYREVRKRLDQSLANRLREIK